MKKERLKTALIILGIFGSVIVGLTLFIVGGVSNNFALSIAGVVVIVGGIILTSFFAILPYIIEAVRNFKKEDPLSAKEAAALDKAMQRTMNIAETEVKEKQKDVSYLMDKEDFLIAELKRTENFGLLNEYQAQADAIWDEYTGENWDDNLEAIDELVDYYMQFIK